MAQTVGHLPAVWRPGFCPWLRKVSRRKERLKVKVKSLSHVRLFATPWTVAYQAPPSLGFSKNTGVGCHFLLRGGSVVKNCLQCRRLPAVRETRIRCLGQENPLEKEMATRSSILAHEQRRLVGYRPWGHKSWTQLSN